MPSPPVGQTPLAEAPGGAASRPPGGSGGLTEEMQAIIEQARSEARAEARAEAMAAAAAAAEDAARRMAEQQAEMMKALAAQQAEMMRSLGESTTKLASRMDTLELTQRSSSVAMDGEATAALDEAMVRTVEVSAFEQMKRAAMKAVIEGADADVPSPARGSRDDDE